MNTRRRKKQQKLQITLLLTGIVILLFVIIFFQLSSNTIIGSKDIEVNYISVEVYEGDTLWDLAEEFIDRDYYDNEEFINEIVKINGLRSETIYPGQRLTMPQVRELFASK